MPAVVDVPSREEALEWAAKIAVACRRLGRSQDSRAAYDNAIELAGNTAETAY